MTTTTTIETADGPMPAAWADAEGGGDRAVIVVQEAFGVTDHIVDVCRRFAAAGWSAVAPALFHRQGSPVLSYADMAQVMPLMGTLTAEGIATDVAATSDLLVARGFALDHQAVVGFCMGGTVTFHAACQRPFGAASTFYGGGVGEGRWGFGSMVDSAGDVQAPWLGLFGDLDQSIPVDDVERLRAALAANPVDTEIVRYADAQHGFHCDDRPAVFHPEAAADAWQRTLGWFDAHIPAGAT